MSLEMAHKVIVPHKKIMSCSFLNSGTLIVNPPHRIQNICLGERVPVSTLPTLMYSSLRCLVPYFSNYYEDKTVTHAAVAKFYVKRMNEFCQQCSGTGTGGTVVFTAAKRNRSRN
jgi:hypothetical protein